MAQSARFTFLPSFSPTLTTILVDDFMLVKGEIRSQSPRLDGLKQLYATTSFDEPVDLIDR